MTASVTREWQIQDWLVAKIAEKLALAADDVEPGAVLGELGLSSIQAVELAADLEDFSGCQIPATFVYDCPTILDAARYVACLTPAEEH
jgi:acyl carrier protein